MTALNFCYLDQSTANVTVLVSFNVDEYSLALNNIASVICLGANAIPHPSRASDSSTIKFTVFDGERHIGVTEVNVMELLSCGVFGSNFHICVAQGKEAVGYLRIVGFCPDSSAESGAAYLEASGCSSSSGLQDRLLVHLMDGLGRPLRSRAALLARFEIILGKADQPTVFCAAETQSTVSTRYLQFDSRLSLDLPRALDSAILKLSLLNVSLSAEDVNTTEVSSQNQNVPKASQTRLNALCSITKSLSEIIAPLQDRAKLLKRADIVLSCDCVESTDGSPALFEGSESNEKLNLLDPKVLRLRLGLLLVPGHLASTTKAIDAVKLFYNKKCKSCNK